ncbi:hypothetical protein EON73_04805 [bacterium]|nr:MAG: hypothetical protein EON73_04805 [bacterium]
MSTEKLFKTTIFGQNESETKTLLSTLFNIIEEPFKDVNLSITSNRNHLNTSKRSTSLGGVDTNPTNYQKNFKVCFKKAGSY